MLLCAGAIDSPRLLLLSGVGPAERLRALGLPIVADLAGVGGNLQDHPLARIRCWTKQHVDVDASSDLVEASLYCDPLGERTGAAPRLSLHFMPVVGTQLHEGVPRSAFAIAAVVLRPDSRGSVEICAAPTRPTRR